MNKSFTLFLLCICGALSSQAQKYYPATLYYADGHSAKMLVKADPPSGNNVITKADEDAKREKIKSDLLQKLVFEVEGSEPIVYERHTPQITGKARNFKVWMQVLVSGPVSLYIEGGSMAMMRAGMPHSVEDVTYYARRTNEENASYLGTDITSGAIGLNENGQFRRYAGEYFSDYPELAERIANKEFKLKEAVQLVQEYNKWAKK